MILKKNYEIQDIKEIKKTNVLILVENEFQSEKLLKNKIFNKYLLDKKYEFYYSFYFSSFVFNYPSDIIYREYPKSNELSFKLNCNITKNERIEYINKENTNKEYFLQFNELILCPNPDHTGVFSAYITLEKTLGKNWKKHFKKITYIKFKTFDTNILNRQFNNLFLNADNGKENIRNEKFYDKSYQNGLIKRYFEFNYNINSNIFLKEILKEIGSSNINLTITKYMLLALYQFKNINGYISDYEFFELLVNHKGTSKYIDKNTYSNYGIGTSISFYSIKMNLIKLELVKSETRYNNQIMLSKTKKGEEFFRLSSKKIFDIDLKYRIEEWSELPFNEAKEKIDRYLVNMFKAQKRKNKHLRYKKYNLFL